MKNVHFSGKYKDYQSLRQFTTGDLISFLAATMPPCESSRQVFWMKKGFCCMRIRLKHKGFLTHAFMIHLQSRIVFFRRLQQVSRSRRLRGVFSDMCGAGIK